MKNLTLKLLWHYSFVRPGKGFTLIRTKIHNALTALIYSRKLIALWPTTLALRLTERCNLRCVECGQWGESGYGKKAEGLSSAELSTDEFKRIFDACAKKGTHIFLWGGEPTLREDLPEIIRYASEKNLTVQISTNGILLRRYARELVAADTDVVCVSLDGPEIINNSIRLGSGNAFQEAQSGVHELLEARRRLNKVVPMVVIVLTITAQNHKHIYETYELARDWGVDVFHVQHGIFTNKELVDQSKCQYEAEFGAGAPMAWTGFIRDVSLIDPHIVKGQCDQIKRDIQENRRSIHFRTTPTFEFDGVKYFESPEEPINPEVCVGPWKFLPIMANGDVAVCPDFINRIIGNIRADSIENIWNNNLVQSWRKHLLDQGICFPACSRCGEHLVTKTKAATLLDNAVERIKRQWTASRKEPS